MSSSLNLMFSGAVRLTTEYEIDFFVNLYSVKTHLSSFSVKTPEVAVLLPDLLSHLDPDLLTPREISFIKNLAHL